MNCRHHCSYADFGLLSCKKASDHTDRPSPSSSAVLPPPLNHGERKEKSPNCSTTLFGHCKVTNPWESVELKLHPVSNQGQQLQSWMFNFGHSL